MVGISNPKALFKRFAPSFQSALDMNNDRHPPAGSYRTVSYYVNWAIYGRNYQPQELPAGQLTHVLYAFANIKPDGEVHLTDTWSDIEKHYPTDSWNDEGTNVYGCIKQLYLLKKKHRHFKVLLSIGGWTYSGNFAGPASTPQGRHRFAETAVSLLKNLGLDGLDLDWEYPSTPAQARDYVALLSTIRSSLTAYTDSLPDRPHFLLTVASPAGRDNYQKLDVRGIDAHIDFWNLMAYDFAGSWDKLSGFQANIYLSQEHSSATPVSADEAVRFYTGSGVSPHKILLGMPLYGRAFDATAGPGTPFSGVGQGSWEPGVWDYKALPRPGATVHHDPRAIATWSYDPSSRAMVTYDDAASAAAKVEYIRRTGLGGAMWWEASGDRRDEGSITQLVAAGLGGYEGKRLDRSLNVLHYPESRYDNLRKGMPGEGDGS